MLATILIWIYTFCAIMLYGWAFLKALQRILNRSGQELPSLPLVWVCGLGVLTTLTSFLSLVLRIQVEASLLSAGGALVIAWFWWKENRAIKFQFSFSKDVLKAAAWLLVIVCVVAVLENATHKPANPDTGIYHAQAIRWIETYPAVPGLGNLHTRLAFNSSWLVINALFSFVYLDVLSFHLLGSVFFVVFLGYCFEGLFRFISGNTDVSDVIRIFLIPISFWVFASEISSPGTDLPSALLIWIILLEFLRFLENGDEVYPLQAELLLGLSVFVLTVKLSSAPILLIGIYMLWWKFKQRDLKSLSAVVGIGVLVLLPWLARNVVLSGYLVYPRPELDFFNVDWKIPFKIAAAEKDVIMAWARIPGRETREVLQMPLDGMGRVMVLQTKPQPESDVGTDRRRPRGIFVDGGSILEICPTCCQNAEILRVCFCGGLRRGRVLVFNRSGFSVWICFCDFRDFDARAACGSNTVPGGGVQKESCDLVGRFGCVGLSKLCAGTFV